MSTKTDTSAVVLYRQRMADFGQQRNEFARRADRVSYGRVATFLAAGICFLAGLLAESANLWWFATGAVFALAFLGLVRLYVRLLAEADRFGELRQINAQAIARLSRNWRQLPLVGSHSPASDEALAGDLDLFGQASLFHLVSVANTPRGIETLGEWFLHPAEPASVLQRQQAVAELAPALDQRQELQQRGLRVAARETKPEKFLRWAEGEPWLARRPWVKWASRGLPLLIAACGVLGLMGVLPATTWMIPFVANMALSSVYCREIHPIFASISTRHGEVGHYADLFRTIPEMPARSAYLEDLREQTEGHVPAYREIRWLGRITDLANLRFSSMAYFMVQSLLAWDFHILALLERWQRRSGRHARQWFAALGEWEALASLAGLKHDNPGWVFPTIEIQPPGKQTLTAQSLGHPLIPDDRRVANDVSVGPPGAFLMVTGSNMSGKSTLLRAIGANVVLAQAGAPVCAGQWNMSPVLPATSMRIHDSLADGVSFYMAELRRLKQIVDAARDRPPDSPRVLLYLLDEILQGTNTAERQIAVRRVVAHLLAEGAIGAISTHDLQLAADPSLASASHAVHFRETIHNESGRQEMTFDYKLREGLATTSNALKLLEMVGLCSRPLKNSN